MATQFIAEVSSNHNTDIERAKRFIDAAKFAGCDGVKFQLFRVEELFTQNVLQSSEQHRKRKQWELPEEFIPELSNYTHELGMLFSCTPFYLEAVDILEPYVDFYKIASYELLWTDLFEKCAATGKPIVLSTGMAIISEVKQALNTIAQGNTKQVTVLHCNSAYPTPVCDANLSAINTLKKELHRFSDTLQLSYGWSDHSVSPAVISRAVHKYASSFVEFHLDLDGRGEEYAAGHCWLPDEIAKVIADIRDGMAADGNGIFQPSPSELPERQWRADPEDGLRPLKEIRETINV